MHVWHRVSCRGVDQTRQFDDMPHCMQAEVSLSVMEQLLKNVRWSHPWYSHLHIYFAICPVRFLSFRTQRLPS